MDTWSRSVATFTASPAKQVEFVLRRASITGALIAAILATIDGGQTYRTILLIVPCVLALRWLIADSSTALPPERPRRRRTGPSLPPIAVAETY